MDLVIRFLIPIAIGYSALVVAVYFLQTRMLYFPATEKPSDSQVHGVGLRFWQDRNDSYRGFAAAADPNDAKGLVVVFHGNAGAAWNRNYYVHALVRLGYNVLITEYPGYGGRTGKLGQHSFVADARETVKRAHEEFGGPVYLWGESLGCGVAAAVAADPPVPVGGVIMFTPWDSLPDLAQTHYWYFPARWLVRDKYDNVRNLQSFDKPVAVVLAAQDEVIPRKHSMRLYDNLAAPKRKWVFEGAGHNTWPAGPAATWWREVMDFVSTKVQGNDA